MSAPKLPSTGDVPPGTFSAEFDAELESTMNATIREAVFVSAHLDAGDLDATFSALFQIRFNSQIAEDRIKNRLLEAAEKGDQ